MVQNQTKTAGIAVSQVLEQKIDIDDASFSELRFETQPAGGDVPLNVGCFIFEIESRRRDGPEQLCDLLSE